MYEPMSSYTRLAEVYDDIVVDPCYGQWAQFMHEQWRTDGNVESVLDVGCGTGLLASELQALGYAVTGIDASRSMLERARHRLGPDTKLVEAMLPDLGVDSAFDAAVSTFDVLNYLTPAVLISTLAAVARQLRPGGWFVFDLHTDAMMEFAATNPVVEGVAEGQDFRISNRVDRNSRSVATHVTFARSDGSDFFEEVHQQYFFADDVVHSALESAKFEVVAVCDEYRDAAVNEDSLRATWVARLPA